MREAFFPLFEIDIVISGAVINLPASIGDGEHVFEEIVEMARGIDDITKA